MLDAAMTLNDFLYMCGAIATIWGACKVLKEIKKPNDDLKSTIKKHEGLLDENEKKIKEIDDGQKIICRSILVMINHELTGNDVDNMKKMRDELRDYLIEK